MSRPFLKMHGLGNDFVLFDGRKDGFIPDQAFCLRVADRHRGVGYDQLIVMSQPQDAAADLYMHIFNADGSKAGACGNATRCVASLLFKETGKQEGIIQTVAGLLKVRQESEDLYSVNFGVPHLNWNEIPLSKEMDTLCIDMGLADVPEACCVNVGNPHAVFFVPDAEAIPLAEIGPKLEHHPLFPERCNIEFAHMIDRQTIRMRVWERGTGITEACGSGATATHIAAVRRGLADRKSTIVLDGGKLIIEWRETDGHVILCGPVSLSYHGTLSNELANGTPS